MSQKIQKKERNLYPTEKETQTKNLHMKVIELINTNGKLYVSSLKTAIVKALESFLQEIVSRIRES